MEELKNTEISNPSKQGAGVFVVINKTDLNGRKLENILDVRSVFADLDGAPLDRVIEYELEPHIIIESSSDRWHAYWPGDQKINFQMFKDL